MILKHLKESVVATITKITEYTQSSVLTTLNTEAQADITRWLAYEVHEAENILEDLDWHERELERLKLISEGINVRVKAIMDIAQNG